jgi:hypothetical protein
MSISQFASNPVIVLNAPQDPITNDQSEVVYIRDDIPDPATDRSISEVNRRDSTSETASEEELYT